MKRLISHVKTTLHRKLAINANFLIQNTDSQQQAPGKDPVPEPTSNPKVSAVSYSIPGVSGQTPLDTKT